MNYMCNCHLHIRRELFDPEPQKHLGTCPNYKGEKDTMNFEEIVKSGRQELPTKASIAEWSKLSNEQAERKGWNENLDIPSQFANFHSEISEAWEEHRNGKGMLEVYFNYDLCNCGVTLEHVTSLALHVPGCPATKPEGIPIEMADCVIRIMHTCGYYGIDLEGMIRLKMGYNESREYRHGKRGLRNDLC